MADRDATERTGAAFDSRHYWEERLLAHPDITGVGYVGLSPQFAEMQFHSRARQLERALRGYHLANLAGRSVLDVGSGTGFWLDFWRQRGATHLAGLDFAQPSVDRLKEQFPDALIVRADLRDAALPIPGESCYDIISAFHVLLHITDPDGLRRAIANLARYCAPGGWLIIADAIVRAEGYVPERHSPYDRVWSLAEYREALEASGLAMYAVWPETVLLDNPLEASGRQTFRAFRVFWRVTRRWGRSPGWSRLLGPALVALERLACRLFPESSTPGSKMIFARKLE